MKHRPCVRSSAALLAVSWLLASCASAQEWTFDYGEGQARQSRATSDGGFIVAAVTGRTIAYFGERDGLLIKLAASGAVEWAVAVGGPMTEWFSGVAVLPDGYLVAGYGEQSSPNDHHLIVLRFDLAGDLIWQRDYGEIRPETHRIEPSSDGAFFVVALVYSPSGGMEDAILKLDADGTIIWHRAIGQLDSGGGGRPFTMPIVATDSGGVVIAPAYGQGSRLQHIVEFDAAGNVSWAHEYGPAPSNYFTDDLVRLADGSLVVCGATGTSFFRDHWIMKTDEVGVPSWQSQFGDWSADDGVRELVVAADGTMIAAGSVGASPTGWLITHVDATGAPGSTHELDFAVIDLLAFPGGLLGTGVDLVTADRIVIGRLDAAGGTTSACTSVTPVALEVFPPFTGDSAVSVTPRVVPTVAVDTSYSVGRIALLPSCPGACMPMSCGQILATAPDPCPGELVSLELEVVGGEGIVTIAWDLDGDGAPDMTGNPIQAPAIAGSWRVVATATDSCAIATQSCAASITLTVPAPLAEISDVPAGAPPLRVSGMANVTFEAAGAATAYNVYVGRIGAWYDSDAVTGRNCTVRAWIDNADGTLTIAGALSPVGSSWILVTAANPCFEGSAGSDSMGRARTAHPSWVACGPAP